MVWQRFPIAEPIAELQATLPELHVFCEQGFEHFQFWCCDLFVGVMVKHMRYMYLLRLVMLRTGS